MPFLRATAYSSGVSSFRHSASDLTILSTWMVLPSLSIIQEEDEFDRASGAIPPGIGERTFAGVPKRHQAGKGEGHEQERAPRRSVQPA